MRIELKGLLFGLNIVILCLNIRVVCAQDNSEERRVILENQISAQIEARNYCNVSEDCAVVSFGCPFGCGSYINKDADLEDLKAQIARYHELYGECVYRCLSRVNPVCVNNKCVEQKCEMNKEYAPFACRCPEGTSMFFITDKENKNRNMMKCVPVN